MSKELALPARCNLCDQTFYGPRLTFVGRPHGRQPQFLEQLAQHIFTDHKDVAEGIALGAGEYQGMFIMSQFSTDDPELVNQLDIARWNVHQKTLKMRVSDQMIADCVAGILPDILTMAQMADTEGLTRNLTGLLMSMREKLEEPNKYILTGQLAADPALVV